MYRWVQDTKFLKYVFLPVLTTFLDDELKSWFVRILQIMAEAIYSSALASTPSLSELLLPYEYLYIKLWELKLYLHRIVLNFIISNWPVIHLLMPIIVYVLFHHRRHGSSVSGQEEVFILYTRSLVWLIYQYKLV